MKCSFCGNNRGGAYLDSCYGFYFNLCLDCSKELGFFPTCLNSQKKCLACGKYFTPKGDWQKSCTDCWLKTNPSKKKSFTFIKKDNPVQRKLNGVETWIR
jgi:hypothetical protein